MNNQEGMLAAASVLRVQGASRPLCPGTPSSSAPTTPGHSLCLWTQPGRASWHRKSHAQPHQLSLRQSSHPAWQRDGDTPGDAPGMGTSTAVPALPLPALPDRAAQPGPNSVGGMVQHQGNLPQHARPPAPAAPHRAHNAGQRQGITHRSEPLLLRVGWLRLTSRDPWGGRRHLSPMVITWHPWPSPPFPPRLYTSSSTQL